jgi:glycosyltransferase involved in cell wall biosynthesis
MGAKQGLEVVVNAARLAQERGVHVRFVLVGDGNQRAILQGMSRDLTHIEFQPVLSSSEYEAALAGADVLLLTQRASVRDMALPSKLTSYLGVGKPVVASVAADSLTAAELLRSGGAVLVPPGDGEALLEAILEIQANAPLRARLTQSAGSYYESELDPDVLRARFVEFVENAVHGGRRALASRV